MLRVEDKTSLTLEAFIEKPSQDCSTVEMEQGVKDVVQRLDNKPDDIMGLLANHAFIPAAYLLDDLAEKMGKVGQKGKLTILFNQCSMELVDACIWNMFDLNRIFMIEPACLDKLSHIILFNERYFQRLFGNKRDLKGFIDEIGGKYLVLASKVQERYQYYNRTKCYADKANDIVYELNTAMPTIDKIKSKLTVRMLTLYGIYRNGLYDERIKKPLDADIANVKPSYSYEKNSLYHYASHVSLDAMQELFKKEDGKCCVAYKSKGGTKIPVGFLVFHEKQVGDDCFVYISHVSVSQFRQGVGTKLLQAVMMSYPDKTKFYLCARKSNEAALSMYQKLGYTIDDRYVTKFDYNAEYFLGMSHTTKKEELSEMMRRFDEKPMDEQGSYFRFRK